MPSKTTAYSAMVVQIYDFLQKIEKKCLKNLGD